MKKTICIIISVILLMSHLGTYSFANDNIPFKDVPDDHWAKDAIYNLASSGIVNGYTDGTYRPNNPVTTSEFLKLTLDAAGIEGIDYHSTPWNKDLMEKAYSLKLISEELYNNPNQPITRKDVAIVIAAVIEESDLLKSLFVTGKDIEYDRFKYLVQDTYSLKEAEKTAIYKLFEYGIVTGTMKNEKVYYLPDSNLSRAEIAVIVERFISPSKISTKYQNYPNRTSIFSDPNTSDLTSTYNFKPDGNKKKFLYTTESDGQLLVDYSLNQKINPNIDQQVYELTKALIDPEHYVVLTPGKAIDYEDRVIVKYANTLKYAYNDADLFTFVLYDKTAFNLRESWGKNHFSENVVISLNINRLWSAAEKAPDNWRTPLYEQRLRSSFIALFGEKTGHDIYEYVLDEYDTKKHLGSTGYANIFKTKVIGNIQVDFVTESNATLMFDFSYK